MLCAGETTHYADPLFVGEWLGVFFRRVWTRPIPVDQDGIVLRNWEDYVWRMVE